MGFGGTGLWWTVPMDHDDDWYLIPKMTFALGLSLNNSIVIGAAGKSTDELKPFKSSIACSPSSLSRTFAHASRRSYKICQIHLFGPF